MDLATLLTILITTDYTTSELLNKITSLNPYNNATILPILQMGLGL